MANIRADVHVTVDDAARALIDAVKELAAGLADAHTKIDSLHARIAALEAMPGVDEVLKDVMRRTRLQTGGM